MIYIYVYIIALFAPPVPMNKVQVGHAPSPNLKAVRSKIGSLDNATYKPGGGHVKIESKKIDIKAAPRIEAKNDKYMPKGGEKKVCSYCPDLSRIQSIRAMQDLSMNPLKMTAVNCSHRDPSQLPITLHMNGSNVRHQPH